VSPCRKARNGVCFLYPFYISIDFVGSFVRNLHILLPLAVKQFQQMSTRKSPTQIVVGAGLVGCLWSIILAKRGMNVAVYERRSDMRKAGYVGGRSINLAMSERGWTGLRKAGIAEQLEEVALPMSGRMMHDTKGNLTYQAYGKQGQAIYSVSRGGLNRALLDIADGFENVAFNFDERCEDVMLDKAAVRFKNGQTNKLHTVKGQRIFGTDGAFSMVRGAMQKTDRFNYSQNYLDYGYKELSIPPTASGDYAMDPNALHIWPRGRFMLIALPNTDKSFTCTLFMQFEGGADSFAGVSTLADWQDFMQRNFADTLPLMPHLVEEYHENPVSSLVTVRCNPWLHKDKVLLLGDAAHAIVPFYGQGMNAGFEDCVILDQLVDKCKGNWPKAMRQFNETRIQDANAIADLALRNFIEMRDLVGDPKFLLRQKISAWLHEQHPQDFVPLYTQVSFTTTPYHKALADGLAQDALFNEILALPDIENNWQQNAELIRIFKAWKKK
jgi:kynurenine 3-monooxygenase